MARNQSPPEVNGGRQDDGQPRCCCMFPVMKKDILFCNNRRFYFTV
ncbi:hypothetical protein CSB69_3547 [Morganella morganii]|nr:hypothetical protein CSB69_3547 [Morganella morganii]